MSIVDDDSHVLRHRVREDQLWQKAAPTPPVAVPMVGTPTSSNGTRGAEPSLFARVGSGDELWQARIDLVVSSGFSSDAAHKARQHALWSQSQASFDALCTKCRDELRPVLEISAEMLHQWGLEAHVTETLRDEPARLPRSFDLSLWIDRFGDRGPGKLTITATEACDFVRVKLSVGPSKKGGEASEHLGTTVANDLSDALVGGLVATLVEQIFSR